MTQEQKTKYLNDIQSYAASDLEALIKELSLKPEFNNDLKAIVDGVCLRIADEKFDLHYLHCVIYALASFKDKLTDEYLTKIVNAALTGIADEKFNLNYLDNVIEALERLPQQLHNRLKIEISVTHLSVSVTEEKEQKRLPDSNLTDLNPSEINPNTVNSATTTPDGMTFDETGYDVVAHDDDLVNLDNGKSINAAQKADAAEWGFDFVDSSDLEEELTR